MRGAHIFKAAGGERLELVTAVNDAPQFIEGLAQQLRAHWSTSP
jgi:protoheme ferro-lyase